MRRLIKAGRRGMKLNDLYRSLGSPITSRSLKIAVNGLIERGEVERKEQRTGFPGRPATVLIATRRHG